MGGTIGITIRTMDRKEHRMLRWTNPMPSFFHDIKFIDGDEGHVNEYLKMWYEMVDAYNNGKLDEMPMADVYVPGAGLYPSEYGLVLVDYPSRTIISSQGYTNVNGIHVAGVSNAAMTKKFNPDKFCENYERYKALFDQKKVVLPRTNKTYKHLQIEGITFEDFIAEDENGNDVYYDAFLDMRPWKVHLYEPYVEKDVLKMKKHVQKLGFTLTESEEKEWRDFIELHKN